MSHPSYSWSWAVLGSRSSHSPFQISGLIVSRSVVTRTAIESWPQLLTGQSVRVGREGVLPMATYSLAHGESLEDGEMTFVLRPMRADDARSYAEIMNASDASSVDFRFPRIRPPLTGPALARFTQIDREREMAFVAAVENGTRDELVGEVRIIVFP